ncbi:hypothetical protein M569_04605 [Genlisea aurea]|uniref:mitogen-activated protein kinase kinase kinase n=1 Tax=Genlisea aurea TaxID=192259 RepID=S8CTH9_9LAMI|nr:hypothetical protein M569_04605 [Genlisea aurea]
MPSWWGKSSKAENKKATKNSFIDTLHKKFKNPEAKSSTKTGDFRRRASDTFSERGSLSPRTQSPSKYVGRCQSFAERTQAQPLPLPVRKTAKTNRKDSVINESVKPKAEKASKTLLFLPLPRPACIRQRLEPCDLDVEPAVASVSSDSSVESDDRADSSLRSPLASDYDIDCRTAVGSPLKCCSANDFEGVEDHDSSLSSPSRSPIRGSPFVKHHMDFPFLGSGQCSSPGSGQTSGHNSMGGDVYGQLFLQPSRGSPEYSPIPSPRMTSPGPSSRIHSGAVTPIHPRAAGVVHSESLNNWPDDAKQQSHRLPLPPIIISNSPFSHQNSAVNSPSVSRSPVKSESVTTAGSRWKKGKMLGRGTFGHVYVGFNSDTGEMCAMKEVTLFADDAKSKESAKHLGQEIALLSRLRHPNIVQYYGSETVGDKLYIYLEYVSGGSIHKILQDYGKLGESAVRSYTQQILSGLAYLHGKNTVHRDIKGANILVDPNGRVKLADFGMAKHVAGQSCPLSFKGSPYWMAPEVIRNWNGCSLAVDIWSLGCTVLEMATAKPPWSQYEGVAAMFKIGNSKELPSIPDNLSEEGKEFVRLCLQRNPLHRPSAAQLLEHPFVKGAAPLEKQMTCPSDHHHPVMKSLGGAGNGKKVLNPAESSESRLSKTSLNSRDLCPPVGSPLLQQHLSGVGSSIPFRNQVTLSQEGMANLQMRPPPSPYCEAHSLSINN